MTYSFTLFFETLFLNLPILQFQLRLPASLIQREKGIFIMISIVPFLNLTYRRLNKCSLKNKIIHWVKLNQYIMCQALFAGTKLLFRDFFLSKPVFTCIHWTYFRWLSLSSFLKPSIKASMPYGLISMRQVFILITKIRAGNVDEIPFFHCFGLNSK